MRNSEPVRHPSPPNNSNSKLLSNPHAPNAIKKKEGTLLKRSDHLKQWRKRFFSCENNFLKISHDIHGKNLIIVDLNNYTPSWQGKIKDKYVFIFQARHGFKVKPKDLVLSSIDEKFARSWFEFLISVMDTTALLAGQVHIINEIGARARSLSNENRGDGPVHQPHHHHAQEHNKSIDHLSERSASPRMINRPNSSVKSSVSSSSNSSQNESALMESPMDITMSEKSSHYENSRFLTDRLDGLPQPIHKKRGSKQDIRLAEFSLPKDAPKWADVIFEKYIYGREMWKFPMGEKINKNEWNIVKDNGQMRIMQSLQKANVFKCLYCLENSASPEKILQVLLDVQNRNKWDTSFGKAALLSYIPSTKQCVIHQVNKPFGMFYFPREFIYARYVFKALDTYFIIDQSIQEAHQIKKSLRCPRGEIHYSIIQIKKEGPEVYLNVLMSITNGGMANVVQDSQITIHSLLNLNHIQKIFGQYDDWNDFEFAFMPTSDQKLHKESVAFDLKFSSSKIPAEIENYQDPDCDEINLQKPIEPNNLVQDLEKEQASMKFLASNEESKIEEDSDPSYIIPKKENSSPLESSPGLDEVDLDKLLSKSQLGLPVLECIDKNVKLIKLSSRQAHAILPDEENQLLCGRYWKRDPANGIRFIDDEFLVEQKKVLGHFIKSMGRNLLEGKSIMNVSLPVTVFSAESMLQRWAYSCGYAPDFLTLAGQQKDRLEAFKYVITYYFTCHHLGIAQIKPFNPILGETYQGYLNGIMVACEQICHHPPISAIHMKTEDFFYHGTQQMDASLGPNSATAQDKRRTCVTLPKLDMNIYVNFPVCLVNGTAFGKRYFNWSKKLRVYDPDHLLYAEITFNPDEKGMISGLFSKKTTDADKTRGAIYKVTPEFMKLMHTKQGARNNDPKAKFNPKEHSVEELGTIEGAWTSYLEFDGKKFWDNETMKPYKLIDMPNKALPSDSAFREDLIYKRMNNDEKAQILKDKLENLQRADRKLREKKNPKGKH